MWWKDERDRRFDLAVGALDFAGGTVVHINAAVAGLVGAYFIGKRVGYGKGVHGSAQPDVNHGGRAPTVGGLVPDLTPVLLWRPTALPPWLSPIRSSPPPPPVLTWSVGEACTRVRPPCVGCASGAVAGW